jgi:tetratricopeptide (TPR) repeat protein
MIRERGTDYDMSHDRIRDVAYAEISPIQRRLLHRKVAQALEQAHSANLDAVSAQLAWHYEHAAAPKRAIDFYQRAGIAAQRMYANSQAIDLFDKGLTLLQELPAIAERDQRELSLQMAMAASLRTKNYLSPELNRVLNRSLELSHRVNDVKLSFWPLWGLHFFHHIRGEIAQAQQIVHSLLAIAEEQQDPNFLIASHSIAGAIDFYLCDYLSAQAHFNQARLRYCVEFHEEQVILTGFDHGIHAQAWLGHNLWILGDIDSSLRQGHQAIEQAGELEHPFSQVLSLAYLAMLHCFRREIHEAQQYADAAMSLASRHEVGYYGAWAAILSAWAAAWQNPGKDEIAALHSALHDFRSPGSGLRWPFYLSLLAEIYGKSGQIDMALATIGEALEAVTTNGEYWWQAELHRMRGVFLVSQGADPEQIEAAFQQALTLARQQKALVLELRATMDLARLWQKTQRDLAYQLLSSVYAQFTEGFDTLDLQEAKELLASLS